MNQLFDAEDALAIDLFTGVVPSFIRMRTR